MASGGAIKVIEELAAFRQAQSLADLASALDPAFYTAVSSESPSSGENLGRGSGPEKPDWCDPKQPVSREP
jgi:hypothetical protein